MSEAANELAELAQDVRAWLEWEVAMGAYALPPDTRPIPVEPAAAPSNQPAASAPQASEGSVARDTHAPDRQNRWKKFAKGDDLLSALGPEQSTLCVIRTAGSSPEAEAMFDKMLENVLKTPRTGVAILELARVRRHPSAFEAVIGQHLERIRPEVVVIMGTLGARALLGEACDVSQARGVWHDWPLPSGAVPVRVTHHPESVRRRREAGDMGQARETYADLKAVAERGAR